MKLLSLNIWGGQVHEPLIKFIKEQSKTVDVFCFQEMLNGKSGQKSEVLFNAPNAVIDIYSQFKDILPEFNCYFASAQDEEGLSISIRKNIKVLKEEDFFIHRFKNSLENKNAETLGRNLESIEFLNNEKKFTIINLHGLWAHSGKGDTPDRLEQSRKIINFLDKRDGAKILCGDFNLLPNTKSIAILEKEMRNLVREFKIKSTRSSLYSGFLDKNDRFADYIFVSKDVKVLNFKVLLNEISDHLPLLLEFD